MGADIQILKLQGDEGYFRDSYNNWNLLWEFDLSWWVDIKDLTKGSYLITPTRAKKLLKLLKDREPTFELNLAKILVKDSKIWDWQSEGLSDFRNIYKPDENLDRVDAVAYYRERYEKFKKFLNKAIELESGIDCSC